MTAASAWIYGGVELFDVITSTDDHGAYLFDRPDGEQLAVVMLGADETGEELIGKHLPATKDPEFHLAMVNDNAPGEHRHRTRVVSNGSVRLDAPIPLDRLLERLIRWWEGRSLID